MHLRKSWLLVYFVLALLFVVACGSDSSDDNVATGEDAVAASILLPDSTFSTDSFVAAGWKKSKQYDTETVPEATEIWYGFYQQKDIEIRFYPSHDIAVSKGVPSAESSIEDAVKRSRGGELLDFSGGSFSGYSDYVVAGNAVLLCQLDRTVCDNLLANIE